jgi:hypothetical protein
MDTITAATLKLLRGTLPGATLEDQTLELSRIMHCSSRTVRNKLSGATKIDAGDMALLEKAGYKLTPAHSLPLAPAELEDIKARFARAKEGRQPQQKDPAV